MCTVIFLDASFFHFYIYISLIMSVFQGNHTVTFTDLKNCVLGLPAHDRPRVFSILITAGLNNELHFLSLVQAVEALCLII